MTNEYILGPRNEIIPVSFEQYMDFLKSSPDRRIVSRNRVWIDDTEIFISTVFLGIDHAFGSGQPILFETMVFGGVNDSWQDRYSTFKEACEGHNKILKAVMSNETL